MESEPGGDAEVGLNERGGVHASHHTQRVHEIRDGRVVAMSRLPQVQDVLRRTQLRREIVYVPASHHNRKFTRNPLLIPVHCLDIFLRGMAGKRKGKEEYLYSAFLHQGTQKALTHGSHSFNCKQHHACLSFVAFTRCHHHSN